MGNSRILTHLRNLLAKIELKFVPCLETSLQEQDNKKIDNTMRTHSHLDL